MHQQLRPPSLHPLLTLCVISVQGVRGRTPLRVQAARVAGVDIPNQKRIEFSLQYIFGVGHTTAKAILSDTVSTALTAVGQQWHTCLHACLARRTTLCRQPNLAGGPNQGNERLHLLQGFKRLRAVN